MLTDAQNVDARRYAGYPLVGDTGVSDRRDLAWGLAGVFTYQSLDHRLRSLSAAEEAVIVTYLTTLNQLEAAIPASGDNLDTEAAAVWKHNANEVRDRSMLFDQWRRRLCGVLGIPPGPALGNGGLSIGRA